MTRVRPRCPPPATHTDHIPGRPMLAEVKMWVFEEYVKKEDGKWVRPARGAKPPEGKTWVDEGYEPLTAVRDAQPPGRN